jgi:hypothetical protein
MVWSTLEEKFGEVATRKWWKVEQLFNFLTSIYSILLGKEVPNKKLISVFVIS